MSTVTKSIALDETLQSTNIALGSLGKDTTLQAIATAIANVGLSNIGNMSSLVTTDKTSLVSAINEVVGDVSDLDTDKADKVTGATNGNLAGLNASGNLTDSGWASDKTTTSASGNPISITGLKSNQLAVNPVITFEPIQAGSGDPSPSNVRAISGYDKIEVLSCGKNIFDKNKITPNNYLDSSGNVVSSASYSITDYIRVTPSGKYTVSSSSTSGNAASICFYDVGKNFISGTAHGNYSYPHTYTIPDNAYYIKETFVSDGINAFQIEEGQTASTYKAYNKTTDLSENLPQTVYGGSLDVRTGKLTDTYKAIDMGSLTWTYTTTSTHPFFRISLSDVGTATPNNSWCEIYPIVTDYADKALFWNGAEIRVFDSSYTDVNTFTDAVSGKKLVYPLDTPNEIQLTPHEISLLKDYAYVSTNGTSMSFDYHNGEIATLGDVAQLGETVNLIGDSVKRYILTGTLSSTIDTAVNVPYPADFSQNNTIVLRAEFVSGITTTIWSNMNGANIAIQVALYPTYISVIARHSSSVGKTFRIYLEKFA